MIILDPVSAFASGVFVSSNVPLDSHPTYLVGGTYALNQRVLDPNSPLIFESLVAGNIGQPLTDKTKWQEVGYVNRLKMCDQYNNTQTVNPESIELVLSPKIISQGLYLGNIYGDEVVVEVTDAVEGVVYSETQSLIVSDSGSSFFNWAFKRIRRKTYFFTALLPVYSNATVKITVKKIGGIARCGVCALGPLVDVGLSQWGLSTEIKDYSTTTFKFDGTSSSVVRGYSKRMSVDILVKTDLIEAVQEQLAEFRQKHLVFVGAAMLGAAIIFGRYSSFKCVIPNPVESKMAMTVEGTV